MNSTPPEHTHAASLHGNRGVDSSMSAPPEVPSHTSHITPQHRGINLNTKGIDTELRRDYLHNNLVIIAPNRGKRPYDVKETGHTLIETLSSPRLDRNQEVWHIDGSHGEWLVKIVENKFPSLTEDNPKAYGKQEIIIDTPLSNTPFSHLSEGQIQTLLGVYQKRMGELLTQNGIEYVLIFRNDGFEAGASLAHAHSQVFALPMIPDRFQLEAKIAEQYIEQNNRSPYDDIIEYEKRHKVRLIAEDDHFLVFCPYASQWPFEAWILPKIEVSKFTEFNHHQLKDIARYLKKITQKLTRHKISFNLYLENGSSRSHRFCLKICGRSNIWGGFELATGIVINTVPPESAAKWYRG